MWKPLISILAVITAVIAVGAVPSAAAQPPTGAPEPDHPDRFIVVLEPGTPARPAATAMAAAVGGRAGMVYEHVVAGFVFEGTPAAAASLGRNPNVRAIVPDGEVELADQAGFGVFRIDAHLSQATSNGRHRGAGTRIAVIDSGIDTDHPDLAPNVDFANAVNCDTASSSIEDGNGHGTHVTGIAAAANNGVGIAGVAAEAQILPLKAFDDTGFASDSEILCAMDQLASVVEADSIPTVLNMSFVDTGADSTCDDADVSDVMHEAVCDLHDLGVVMVAGAGNSAIDISTQVPARWDEVIAVSSLSDFDGEPGGLAGCELDLLEFGYECDDEFTAFSNHGSDVDVIAPGVKIYSTVPGGWATKSGTSMAAPHVSGVVAIVLAADPTLTKTEIEALLQSTGECPDGSINSDGGTCAGAGSWPGDPDGSPEPLVNALRAVQAAEAGAPTNQNPVASFTSSCDGLTCTFIDTSTDDGTITAHSWVFGDGTTSSLRHPTVVYPVVGSYTVSLTVTDNHGATSTTTATVTPTDSPPPNQAPVADAGADQSVPDTRKKGTERVDLDGTASTDPDGTIASYTWRNSSGAVIGTGSAPSVTLAVGTHVLTLTVVDDNGASDQDQVTVTVGVPPPPVNSAPVANAGPDQVVSDDDGDGIALVSLDGSGSTDTDGDATIVSYVWTDALGGVLGSGAQVDTTLPLGSNVVTLTVTDDQGESDTDAVTIVVDLPVATFTSHVHDLEVTPTALRGGKWSATVDVFVVFTDFEPLGAIIGADPSTVTITTDRGDVLSCTTSASSDQTSDGRCSVTLNLSRQTSAVTFTVDNVWTPGFTYDPAGNHTGSTVTALKP